MPRCGRSGHDRLPLVDRRNRIVGRCPAHPRRRRFCSPVFFSRLTNSTIVEKSTSIHNRIDNANRCRPPCAIAQATHASESSCKPQPDDPAPTTSTSPSAFSTSRGSAASSPAPGLPSSRSPRCAMFPARRFERRCGCLTDQGVLQLGAGGRAFGSPSIWRHRAASRRRIAQHRGRRSGRSDPARPLGAAAR